MQLTKPLVTRPSMRGPAVLRVAAAVLLLGIGSTLFWLWRAAAWPADFGEAQALVSAVTVVSLITLIHLFLRWMRWHFLCRHLNLRLPARESVLVFGGMLPAILTPLAVGETVAGLFLRAYSAAPWRLAIRLWAVSRLADAASLALVAGLGHWVAWLLFAVLLALFAVVCIFEAVPMGRPRSLRENAVDSILILSLSAAAWLLPGIGLWLACAIAGHGTGFGAASSMFASATLLGALTLSPAGIVTTGSLLIDNLVQSGLPLRTAVQVALSVRSGTVAISVIAGLLIWAFCWRPLVRILHRRQKAAQTHFDELSSSYDHEIPAHIRDRLLKRKTGLIVRTLASKGISAGAAGFDLGCGQGWYAMDLARRGFVMAAGDMSEGQLSGAAANARTANVGVALHLLDGTHVPLRSGSLDFVYSINVLHHVTNPGARRELLQDVVRVLKPGGIFILHEINTRNPAFRLYMSYLFPLLRNIDDGTERWIRPDNPPAVEGAAWDRRPTYFTFLPDFLPPGLTQILFPLEARLERSRLDVWSAHYQHVLTKHAG